jgi:serine protease Do
MLAAFLNPASAVAQDGPGLATALEDSFVSIIDKASPAVVALSRERALESPSPLPNWNLRRRFGGNEDRSESVDPADPQFAPSDFGAGVVIDPAGLILTNYHVVQGVTAVGSPVVEGAPRLFVRFADRRVEEGHILAADPRSDLAVVQVPLTNLPVIPLGKASPVKRGQFVVALGNPYAIARDGSASASWGIVGNIARRIPHDRGTPNSERQMKETLQHLGILLQIDTRLELGTSGGALLNLKGELIGLTTSMAAISGYERASGFAIRLDEPMLRVVETLRQGKEVEYGFLGVMPDDVLVSRDPVVREEAAQIGQGGAARVSRDPEQYLPAYNKLQAGDLILKINGEPIYSKGDLMRVVGLAGPRAEVRIEGYRPKAELPFATLETDRRFTTSVQLGKWPVIDEEGIVATRPTWEPWRGLTIDYATSRLRHFQRLAGRRELVDSVLVRDIQPDSLVSRAGLQRDDFITHVDGKPVRYPAEFVAAIRKNAGPVTLRIWTEARGRGESRELVVAPR